MSETTPRRATAPARPPDFAALAEITDAVEAGAGLPEILRAAARVLDSSLVLIDRSAAVLAVAARSPADERSLMRDADDVTTVDLKVAEAEVGRLRMRARDHQPDPPMLRLVSTLIASEVERVRAPERASEEAAMEFARAALQGQIVDHDDLVARGKELGTDLANGGSVVVVRGHPRTPREGDWRRRLLAVATRGARSIAPGAIGLPTSDDAGEIVLVVPDPGGDTGRRVAGAIRRELESGLPGVPGLRRERQRHRRAPVHASPHDPLPVRTRSRAHGARRVFDRRAREAVAGTQGHAGAGHPVPRRTGHRARSRGRPGSALGRVRGALDSPARGGRRERA
jgi:hypothetical protein